MIRTLALSCTLSALAACGIVSDGTTPSGPGGSGKEMSAGAEELSHPDSALESSSLRLGQPSLPRVIARSAPTVIKHSYNATGCMRGPITQLTYQEAEDEVVAFKRSVDLSWDVSKSRVRALLGLDDDAIDQNVAKRKLLARAGLTELDALFALDTDGIVSSQRLATLQADLGRGAFAVIYRQVERVVYESAIIVGANEQVGKLVLNDYRITREIALGDSCPDSSLPTSCDDTLPLHRCDQR